jgi:acyl-coenzyme A synthetase/AMP-(fatty) acid ligase
VKGVQVAPAELEAILLDHPGVADAAVAGVRRSDVKQLPISTELMTDRDTAATTRRHAPTLCATSRLPPHRGTSCNIWKARYPASRN